ncbi:MAG: hypothetical protein K2X48_07620 [Chitinophagaceae bacterium]|nr:hypothetical protein [Chitinophagaceae bacterium]
MNNGLLKNLWNKGELPTVNTAVELTTDTLVKTGVAIVLVVALCAVIIKLINRL